jgi:ABC-type polysaccharide/polyol phosphate transport system ATPase subunit
MERASLVVFATHSLDVLPRFCERTILLRHGRIVADGPTDDVVRVYTEGRQVNEPTLASATHGA